MEVCSNLFFYFNGSINTLDAACSDRFLAYPFYSLVFRDPERSTPQDSNLIISSADGKVCLIDEAYPPEELSMGSQKMKRICVFMNVFNVHVNRSPIKGVAKDIVYKKGNF